MDSDNQLHCTGCSSHGQSGYWNLSAGIGCTPCACHPDGSQLGVTACDLVSGQCSCKFGVGGRACDECLPSYFNFSSQGCQGQSHCAILLHAPLWPVTSSDVTRIYLPVSDGMLNVNVPLFSQSACALLEERTAVVTKTLESVSVRKEQPVTSAIFVCHTTQRPLLGVRNAVLVFSSWSTGIPF